MNIADRRAQSLEWIGRTIAGRYLLQRVVGVGGHGAVFEALHQGTGKRVAVKLLLIDASVGRTVPERFLRESQVARKLNHPGIVAVLDAGTDPSSGVMYLVQEFLEGADLRARIGTSTKLTASQCLAVGIPVARALVAAHAAGIVHRDLKPGNIFLAREASGRIEPKLIDFGISKRLDDEATPEPLTQDGALLGTPDYMSPEQAKGSVDLDGRTDVWSLGVVLYELLAGRRPFVGANYNVVIVAIAHETPPRLDGLVSGLPPLLVDAIHKALEKDLAHRYPSMQGFLEALMRADATPAALDTLPDGTASATIAQGPDTLDPELAKAMAVPVPAVSFGATVTMPPPPPSQGETPSAFGDMDMRLPPPKSQLPKRLGQVAGALVGAGLLGVAGWFGYQTLVMAPPVSTSASVGDGGGATGYVPRTSAEPVRAVQPVGVNLREGRELVGVGGERRLPERLSSTQLRVVLPGWEPRVRACVGAGWFGAVPVVIRATGDGVVRDTTVGGTLAHTPAAACIARALSEERLPRFNARDQRIEWSWTLHP